MKEDKFNHKGFLESGYGREGL